MVFFFSNVFIIIIIFSSKGNYINNGEIRAAIATVDIRLVDKRSGDAAIACGGVSATRTTDHSFELL